MQSAHVDNTNIGVSNIFESYKKDGGGEGNETRFTLSNFIRNFKTIVATSSLVLISKDTVSELKSTDDNHTHSSYH